MKYKLLKDLPGILKGQVVEDFMCKLDHDFDTPRWTKTCNPAHYPDWFEEIKEPKEEPPEELLSLEEIEELSSIGTNSIMAGGAYNPTKEE